MRIDMKLLHLTDRGFDRSERRGQKLHVRCSQCEVVTICGIACHETGCPNQTRSCDECGQPIPKRQRLCESCAEDLYGNPVFEDSEECV